MSAVSKAVPTSRQVVGLYRSFLRESRSVKDYNIAAYFERRTKHAFRAPLAPDTPDARTDAYQRAVDDLVVLKRCAALSNLYPSSESVMEHRLSVEKVG